MPHTAALRGAAHQRLSLLSFAVVFGAAACGDAPPCMEGDPMCSAVDAGPMPALDAGAPMADDMGEADAFVPELGVTLSPADLRLRRGESAAIEVTRSGFDGPVAITVDGLPAGVAANPLTLPAGVDGASIVIQATDSAALGGLVAFVVRLGATDEPALEATAEGTLVVADAPGMLDESFGQDGLATITHEDEIDLDLTEVAIDDESRVVMVGYLHNGGVGPRQLYMARVRADGESDSGFGDRGFVIGTGDHESQASSFVLDGNELRVLGRAQATTEPESSFRFLSAWTENGRLDPSFGDGGEQILPDWDRIFSIALNRVTGRLFLGGQGRVDAVSTDGTSRSLSVPADLPVIGSMIHSNGTLTFGTGARTSGEAVAVVGRLRETGGLDRTFGDDGYLWLEPPPGDRDLSQVLALVVTSSGDGYAGVDQGVRGDYRGEPELIRFTADGVLDSSFGTDGRVRFEDRGFIHSVVVDREGRPVVYGFETPDSSSALRRIKRYTASGTPDSEFGEDGTVDLSALDLRFITHAGHDAAADRLVACGRASAGSVRCARFWL